MPRGRPRKNPIVETTQPVIGEVLTDITNEEPIVKKKRGRKPKDLSTIVPKELPKPKMIKNYVFVDEIQVKYWLADDIWIIDIDGNVLKYHKFLMPETRVNYHVPGDIFMVDSERYLFVEADETGPYLIFILDPNAPIEEKIDSANEEKNDSNTGNNILKIFKKRGRKRTK